MINWLVRLKVKHVVVFILLSMGFLIIIVSSIPGPDATPPLSGCTPAFQDGGGPYYKSNVPFRSKIAPDVNNGEKLIIKGRVLRVNCKIPVPGAVIDLWQASEEGSYQDEYYRGKILADKNGNFKFETVIPKGYGEGTAFRPPHIHFKVFIDNKEMITSQMFFPESKGKPGFDDAYIMSLESKKFLGKTVYRGYHYIILPE